MDSSDESRKKALLEQKTFRKLHRTPKSQPATEQNMAPGSGRGVNRVPVSAFSLTSPEKIVTCDEVDTTAESSPYSLGTSGQGSGLAGDISDMVGDEVDGHSYPAGHPKTRALIEQLQSKIQRTVAMIKEEQNAKSENVNEYLRLSADADRQQASRIKIIFEKKNQKSTQTIAQLQRKLDDYQKRLKDAETCGITGHKLARGVLKDVGQGLKEFFAREPVRSRDGSPSGMRDTSLSSRDALSGTKTKSVQNRFGSADNISSVKSSKEGTQGTVDEKGEKSAQSVGPYSVSVKDVSDEEASSIISDSVPSGEFLSSFPTVQQQQDHLTLASSAALADGAERHSSPGVNHHETTSKTALRAASSADIANIISELHGSQVTQKRLQTTLDSLKSQLETEGLFYRQALEEERYHCERLEEQINDLSELHQHEVTNIKQELSSMQEKMEYQLEERTRDMQELLESCQTKITKMELQQQQQQLISMEGIENSTFRALITKLINVMLALLAVVLVLVSTVANLIGPFLTTRLRIISTVCLIAGLVATWDNWPVISDMIHMLVDKSQHFIST